MMIDILEQVWKKYQDAFADVSPEERTRLLQESVTADVVFTNPQAEGQGVSRLVASIEQFQQQFPGAYFHSNKLISQHGQLLSEWTMFNKDGSEFLTAHSYARFNEEGRLTHLAGFWKL